LLCIATFAAAQAPQTRDVTITGRVTDPAGEPLSRCRVFAKSAWFGEAYAETQADESGAFTITVTALGASAIKNLFMDGREREQKYTVIAAKEAYALGWLIVTEGDKPTVKLGDSPVTCAGRAIDREGNPLAGVTVNVTSVRYAERDGLERLYVGTVFPLLSDVTDEAGCFEISGLPRGGVLGLRASAEGMVQLQRAGNVESGAQDTSIVLQPAASISGRITRDGQPVADVEIRAQSTDSISHKDSDAAGEFKFDGLSPGMYNVLVKAPEGYTAVAAANIKLEAGDHRQGVDLELIEGGFVEGTVTEAESGQPVVGVLIRAHGPADPSSRGTLVGTSTDEAGRYRLRLPPGDNTVSVSSSGKDYEPAEPGKLGVEVVVGKATSGIDFKVTKPKLIKGIGRGPDGKPVAGLTVVVAIEGMWHYSPDSRDAIQLYETQTDEAGRFEFRPGQGPGYQHGPTYAVFAKDAEQGLAGAQFVFDLDSPVEVNLQPGAYILATVADTEGNPLEGMPVAAELKADRSGPGPWTYVIMGRRSDAEGSLRIGPLPAGYPLRVRPVGEANDKVADDTWRELGAISLREGEEYQLPPLVLNLGGRTVRGWVGDEEQNPVSGARILVTKCKQAAETDADGDFEIAGLPMKHDVWIVAIHPTKALYKAERLNPDWGFEPGLILEPPGEVTGQIQDAAGNPVTGLRVELHSLTYLERTVEQWLPPGATRQTTQTDADGKFSFEGLIGGIEYWISTSGTETDLELSERFTALSKAVVQLGTIVATQKQRP